MKHQVQVRFPAPSAVVIKAFTEKAFHTAKLERMGIVQYDVLEHRFDGSDFSIRIRRKVPLSVPIPGALKKLIGGGEVTLVHEDCWNLQARSGHVKLELQGMPVDLSCELSLADEGDACIYTYLWDIRARVPLIGGVLEKTLVADLERKIPVETDAGIALLGNYG